MMTRSRLLCISVFACLVFSSPSAWSLPLSLNRYDDTIQSSVRTYWPTFDDWKYWKAQLYQESRFNPDARSQVGASGLAQFMPGTWGDVTRQLGWSGISANQAAPAIQAGAYYMAKLRRSWSSPRTELQRHHLALASYNAGAGNILRAQRLCSASNWPEISPCLQQVTGHFSAETVTYVERIQRWRADLEQ